jgi:hypothetical protein
MRSMRAWARLAYHLQRFELSALAAGTVLYIALAGLAVTSLDGIHAAHRECFTPFMNFAAGGCQAVLEAWRGPQELAHTLVVGAWGLPFAVGVVLGLPIVAREIEHRTGHLAWSLAPSRTRWLAARSLPVVLAVIGALVVIAIASERLSHAVLADSDLSSSFLWYDRRGLLLPLRALLAFGASLAVGSILGRQLPGILVAAGAVAILMIGLQIGIGAWRAGDAVPLADSQADAALHLSFRVETADGRILTFQEADAEHLIPTTGSLQGETPPGYHFAREVSIGVPGTLAPKWVALESAVTLLAAAGMIGLSAAVVRRRRPE